jgi:predicted TIM-barrel fold metal-dependent hydrolase
MPTKPQVIALEEHYLDPELATHFTGLDAVPPHGAAHLPKVPERLYDLGELRLKEMDEAGVDFRCCRMPRPGAEGRRRDRRQAGEKRQRPAASDGAAHPDRFAAFAALPTADPERRRRRTRTHRHQARLQGRDDPRPDQRALHRRPALLADLRARRGARRAALHAPLDPRPRVIEVYYKDYVEKFPTILRAAWGFTVETATQGVRLVLSGVFEKYPGLKIILGHLGEGLPLYLWRINMGFARDGRGSTWFRDAFTEHFWVTTSGFFSDPALLHCIQEIGIDRVLFSIDYPFVDNPPGTAWAERLPVSAADQAKILSGNAKRLLKL